MTDKTTESTWFPSEAPNLAPVWVYYAATLPSQLTPGQAWGAREWACLPTTASPVRLQTRLGLVEAIAKT